MSKIGHFFTTIGHDIKVGFEDVGGLFGKIFGAQAWQSLVTTGEQILESGIGQAMIEDAGTLLLQVKQGTISESTAIVKLAEDFVTQLKAAGHTMETSLSTMVASMAFAKAQGLLQTATTATTATAAAPPAPAPTPAPAATPPPAEPATPAPAVAEPAPAPVTAPAPAEPAAPEPPTPPTPAA